MGSMGGGGSSTTSNKPWSGQQPWLTKTYEEAGKLYDKGPQSFFPGKTYTGFSEPQLQSQEGALGYAKELTPYLNPMIKNSMDFGLNAMDVRNNPYAMGAVNAAIDPVTQALQEQWLPSIKSDAISGGAFGGSRQGVAEGEAIGNAYREAANATGNIMADFYGKGLDTFSRTMALAPQTLTMGLMPSEIQGMVGGQQQQMDQNQIDENIARFNFNQQAPWDNLSNLTQILQGGPAFSSSTTTGPKVNGTQNAIMGGLGGAAMGSMIPGLGAGAGAGLAGLLGPAGIALGLLGMFAA